MEENACQRCLSNKGLPVYCHFFVFLYAVYVNVWNIWQIHILKQGCRTEFKANVKNITPVPLAKINQFNLFPDLIKPFENWWQHFPFLSLQYSTAEGSTDFQTCCNNLKLKWKNLVIFINCWFQICCNLAFFLAEVDFVVDQIWTL